MRSLANKTVVLIEHSGRPFTFSVSVETGGLVMILKVVLAGYLQSVAYSL